MKRTRFTEEQIAFALRQVEGGVPVKEVCQKLHISEQTFYPCCAPGVKAELGRAARHRGTRVHRPAGGD